MFISSLGFDVGRICFTVYIHRLHEYVTKFEREYRNFCEDLQGVPFTVVTHKLQTLKQLSNICPVHISFNNVSRNIPQKIRISFKHGATSSRKRFY